MPEREVCPRGGREAALNRDNSEPKKNSQGRYKNTKDGRKKKNRRNGEPSSGVERPGREVNQRDREANKDKNNPQRTNRNQKQGQIKETTRENLQEAVTAIGSTTRGPKTAVDGNNTSENIYVTTREDA